MQPKILTVKINCVDDKVLKKKFLIYDDFVCSPDDLVISECVKDTQNGESGVEEVTVTVKMQWS
jgi:hypothetical protein